MKRKLILILVGILLLCSFGFVACENNGQPESHQHVASESWQNDATNHWHPCEDNSCNEKLNIELHNFEDTDGGVRCSVCNYFVAVEEHQHIFSESYTYNEEYHWHVCNGNDDCPEINGYSLHNYENPKVTQTSDTITRVYTCSDCGYVKTETTNIQSVISGEKAWKNAFDNLEFVNFSMCVTFDFGDMPIPFDDNLEGYVKNKCIITEDSAIVTWYEDKNGNYLRKNYLIKQNDGSYNNYVMADDKIVLMGDTSDYYYRDICTQAILDVDFSENFSSFTYDEATGSYRCEDRIEVAAYYLEGDKVEKIDKLYCYNIIITIVDGKIDSIKSDYDFDIKDDPTKYSFEYYNIGTSVVNLPESIKENATSQVDMFVGTYYLNYIDVTDLDLDSTRTYYLGEKYFYVDSLPKDLIYIEIKNDGTAYINAEGNEFTVTYTFNENTIHGTFSEPVAVFGNANSELVSYIDAEIISEDRIMVETENSSYRFEYYLLKDDNVD